MQSPALTMCGFAKIIRKSEIKIRKNWKVPEICDKIRGNRIYIGNIGEWCGAGDIPLHILLYIWKGLVIG